MSETASLNQERKVKGIIKILVQREKDEKQWSLTNVSVSACCICKVRMGNKIKDGNDIHEKLCEKKRKRVEKSQT